MKKAIAALAVLVGLGMLFKGQHRETPPPRDEEDAPSPPEKREERVLLLGDSLAVGLTPTLGRAFRHFRSEAEVGARVRDWASGKYASRLDRALSEFRPTTVLISLGTNDEARRRTEPDFDVARATQPVLSELLSKLHGARIIWIGLPSFSKWPADEGLRELFAEVSSRYYDTAAHDDAFSRAGDKVHFTTTGYRQWGEAFLAWL